MRYSNEAPSATPHGLPQSWLGSLGALHLPQSKLLQDTVSGVTTGSAHCRERCEGLERSRVASSALCVWSVRGSGGKKSSSVGNVYPSLLPLLRLHTVQSLHQAGDALFQAVNGVVLGVMAAETVPQAAEGITHQLQVVRLPKRPGEISQCRDSDPQCNLPPSWYCSFSQAQRTLRALHFPLQAGSCRGKDADWSPELALAKQQDTYHSVGCGSSSFSCCLEEAIALSAVARHLLQGEETLTDSTASFWTSQQKIPRCQLQICERAEKATTPTIQLHW